MEVHRPAGTSHVLVNAQSEKLTHTIASIAHKSARMRPVMKRCGRGIRLCLAVISCALLTLSGVVWACTSHVIALPNSPYRVVTGDFNGDGKLDIAMSQNSFGLDIQCGSTSIPCLGTVILLGNGDGTYQDFRDASGTPVRVANVFAEIAVADFNGDGKLDLVGTSDKGNSLSGNLTLALGNGDGTFRAPVNLGIANASFVGAADINGDGRPDLVVGYSIPGTPSIPALVVLLGNGDGTFTPLPPITYPANNGFLSITIADLNGDGKPEVIVSLSTVSRSGSTIIYTVGADGSLHQATVLPVFSASIAVGDLNHDGIPDLVFGGSTLMVNVLVGKGNLTYGAPVVVSPISGTVFPIPEAGVAITDFDGDGKPDLLITHQNGTYFLKGNGDGTFQPAQALPVGTGGHIAVGNFTADSLPDVVAWGFDSHNRSAGGLLTNTLLRCVNLSTASSDSNPVPGENITLTTHVDPASGTGVPTGSVTYTISSSTPAQFTVPLVNGQASVTFNANLLDINANFISLSYSGDSVFDANNLASLFFSQQGPGVVSTVAVSVAPIPLSSGQPFIATVTVSAPTTLSLAGVVNIIDNAGFFGFGQGDVVDSSGHAVVHVSGLSPRTHQLTAQYSPQAAGNYKVLSATGSTTVDVTGPRLNTTITMQCNAPNASTWDVCTAMLTASTLDLPTGTVTLLQDGTAVGTGALTKLGGDRTLRADIVPASHAGTYVMISSYAGDSGFLPSTSAPLTLTVPKVPTAATLTSSDSSTTYTAGSPVHLHVQMTHSTFNGGPPTAFGGTLAILDGTTTVASIAVSDANLQNDFSMTTLAVGTHTLTAQYGGAQDYAAATSATLAVTVVAAPDFSVTSTSTATTIQAGQSASTTLTFTPSNGFSGPLTFDCSGLPALAACSFSPASPTLSNAPLAVVVTITTTGPIAQNDAPPLAPRAKTMWAVLALGLSCGLVGIVFVGGSRLSRSRLLLLFVLLMVSAQLSCGGGGSTPSPTPQPRTPSGTSHVLINAHSGQLTHTIAFDLTVN
jgi:hypothetical protein